MSIKFDVPGSLNQELPALARVLKLSREVGEQAAWSELLEYFRQRPQKYHFNLDAPLRDLDRLQGEADSSTLDAVMRHELTFCGMAEHFGDEINWRFAQGYLEWDCCLCRQSHWLTLAEGYRRFGDEKYAAELVAQLVSWDAQVPPEFPSRGYVRAIDVGIRLTNWVRLFPVIIHAKAFTPQALEIFLRHIHGACEVLNRHGASGYCPDNHGVYEAMGVLYCGVYFSELCASERWRKDTLECLTERVGADCWPDGTHVEQSPGYHNGMLQKYLTLAQLMRISGQDVSERFASTLHSMADFSAASTFTDGRCIAWGDSHMQSNTALLESFAEELQRPDLLYIASRGAAGEKPLQTSRIFPEGGYGVLRGDAANKDACGLMFDFGPHGGWHGHYDLLSVVLYGYGRPLAIDPGCYQYNEQWRPLMRSTRLHNTICLDGQNYLDAPLNPRAPSRGRLESSRLEEPLKVLHAWHDAYSTPHDNVTVERQIAMLDDRYWLVADRVMAKDPHDIEVNWHFEPTMLSTLQQFEDSFVTSYEDANLAIIPLLKSATPLVTRGWFEGRETPSLRYAAIPCNHWFFVTLLVPFTGKEVPLTSLDIAPGQDGLQVVLGWSNAADESVDIRFGTRVGEGCVAYNGLKV